jgi:hypothetical protein
VGIRQPAEADATRLHNGGVKNTLTTHIAPAGSCCKSILKNLRPRRPVRWTGDHWRYLQRPRSVALHGRAATNGQTWDATAQNTI